MDAYWNQNGPCQYGEFQNALRHFKYIESRNEYAKLLMEHIRGQATMKGLFSISDLTGNGALGPARAKLTYSVRLLLRASFDRFDGQLRCIMPIYSQ